MIFFNQRYSKNIVWSILASKWKLESNYLTGKMWSKITHKISAAVKHRGNCKFRHTQRMICIVSLLVCAPCQDKHTNENISSNKTLWNIKYENSCCMLVNARCST